MEKLEKVTVGGTLSLIFTTTKLSSKWRATCTYPECCPAHIDVSISGTVTLSGPPTDPYNPWWQQQHTVALIPSAESRKEWVDTTGEKPVCHAEHYIEGTTLSSDLAVGVRIGFSLLSIGYSLASSYAEVKASILASCGTGELCGRLNRAPTLQGPHYFTIPVGGTHELMLVATDENGAKDIKDFRLPNVPPGVLVTRGPIREISPNTKQISFTLYTNQFFLVEPQTLEAEVEDLCGKKGVLKISVTTRGKPPRLNFVNQIFEAGEYLVLFEITDEDPGDRFLVEVIAVGGEATPSHVGQLWCAFHHPCKVHFSVKFVPKAEATERSMIVTVTDAFGLSASLPWSSPRGPINRPPLVIVLPAELRVVSGQLVSANVVATDPDGDQVVLRKTGGPGSCPTVEGFGRVQGVWTWTVPDYLRSYAGYVSFAAADIWSAGYGFLYVRT
ncbi:MAG: hypothetical protein ABDI20_09535, partial [Candidatus Bipolaricaulaceae bacterium]